MKFFTVPQAAEAAGKHPKTISLALRSGEMVGHQRVKGGRWSVEDTALRDWIVGGGV